MKHALKIFAFAVFIMSFALYLSPASTVETRSRTKYTKSKDGLSALMDLGKDNKGKLKILNEDDRNYAKALSAVNMGKLEKGFTKENVRSIIGAPVLESDGKSDKRTVWLYKPGITSFFNGGKIYVVFDEDSKLSDWTIVKGKVIGESS